MRIKYCPGTDTQTKHGLEATEENFGCHSSRPDGLQAYCKACQAYKKKQNALKKQQYVAKLENWIRRKRKEEREADGSAR